MTDKLTATITDIQTNAKTGISIVGVKFNIGKRELIKAFEIKPSDTVVTFEEFKVKLVELVREDLLRQNVKDCLKEIEKRKGVPFSLDIKEDTPQTEEVKL